MQNILVSLWEGFCYFLYLFWPWAPDRSFRIPAGLKYFLHAVLMLLVLLLMYFLNGVFGIDKEIPTPAWAQDYWLPMFVALIYALALTGYWIYKLLVAEAEATDFPDIDEAWDEARTALDQAGISLGDVPIFLVLGKTETPEEFLFQGAQLNLIVKQAPVGAKHPLHVYANRDAIYITCAGCSLMGRQASLIALEGISDDIGEMATGPDALMGADAGATLKPGKAEQNIIKQLARMIGKQVNSLQKRALRRASNVPMPNLLNNAAEVEHHSARLAHFCRLIFRDRQPLVPINGMLALIPLGATDTDIESQQSADLCARDIATIRRVLKVRCPMYAMLVDMEQLPGFKDFVHRRPAGERARRVGQRFPLCPPSLQGDAFYEKLDESILFLSESVVRDLVYRLFKVETSMDAKLTVNHELFLFLDEMRDRKDRLSRFIMQGLARDFDGPLLFGGCYLAGTGADKERDQAFTRGVLQRLLDSQNLVSWTDQALTDDARSRTVTFFGYIVLAALVTVVIAVIGYPLAFPNPSTKK